MPVWCLLRALFLCNSKQSCPWSFSSAFTALRCKFPTQFMEIEISKPFQFPLNLNVKIQAERFLFGEADGKVCVGGWRRRTSIEFARHGTRIQHTSLLAHILHIILRLVLHEERMPDSQLADIGRLMWSVILPPPEGLIRTTRAQRQSQFTPIFMSAPLPDSRRARSSCCPPPRGDPCKL